MCVWITTTKYFLFTRVPRLLAEGKTLPCLKKGADASKSSYSSGFETGEYQALALPVGSKNAYLEQEGRKAKSYPPLAVASSLFA
jgi:hypothetical protein